MSTVTVAKRGADRVRRGHLWIYRSDVVDVAAEGGSVVVVRDERGNFVGQALYSDASQIALRFLAQTQEEIDSSWWRARIRAAVARRSIPADTNAYRLVYSEGDLLPSLIVDRYDDVLVLQTLSQGSDRLKAEIAELFVELCQPRAIVERNDARVRRFEGLEAQAGLLHGEDPHGIE